MKEEKRLKNVHELFNCVTAKEHSRRKKHIVDKKWFKLFMMFVVFISALLLGLEADLHVGDSFNERKTFFMLDILTFLLFSGELYLRVEQVGWDFVADVWNMFDYTLVVFQAADLYLSLSEEGSAVAGALRGLRCLRVARSIKGLRVVKGLWMVVQGMLDSLQTIFWVGVFLSIIVYCLAITLTTACHTDYVHDHWMDYSIYVGSVSRSYWTVMQVVSFDAWTSDVGRHLLETSSIGLFVIYLSIAACSLSVFNVILGVMIEKALEMSKAGLVASTSHIETAEQEVYLRLDEELCQDADRGHAGEVSLERFEKLFATKEFRFTLRLLGLKEEKVAEVFNILDPEQTGYVVVQSFIAGLQKMKGVAIGVDMVSCLSFISLQGCNADDYIERAETLIRHSGIIEDRLASMGKVLSGELNGRRTQVERTAQLWENASKRKVLIRKASAAARTTGF